MNTVMFKNIPEIGDLILEKVLFEFEYDPIIFVCMDKTNDRYLCICDDFIERYSWIITRISVKLLLELLRDEITILSPFKSSDKEVIVADRDFCSEECKYQFCKFKDIDEDELPHRDQYLLKTEDLDAYINNLSATTMFVTEASYLLPSENEYMDSLYNSLKILAEAYENVSKGIVPVLEQTVNILNSCVKDVKLEISQNKAEINSRDTATIGNTNDLSYAA